MEIWNNILTTAMIGTDKKAVDSQAWPTALAEAGELMLANEAIDQEERFLQMAALVSNCRQCGAMPVPNTQALLPLAPQEELGYCSNNALLVLKDLLAMENMALVALWLQLCEQQQQLVQPEIVATLLALAEAHAPLRNAVAACCGKRGQWLGQLNPAWVFAETQAGDDLWQTGTLEQRKTTLAQLRSTDANAARNLLVDTWDKEDAATKTTLLATIEINISDADIVFLEGLLTEKSKKVKEEAIRLLKLLPGSALVKSYEVILTQTISLKKERLLLGLTSKTTLEFTWPTQWPETLFANSLQKLSSSKHITDDEYVAFQLIQAVPPDFWQTHLQCSAMEAMDYFNKDTVGKKMVPALVTAAATFKNQTWALLLAKHADDLYMNIVPLLPSEIQEQYCLQHFSNHAPAIIAFKTQQSAEWSLDLCRKILTYAAANSYQYTRAFFAQYIVLMPVSIVAELGAFSPKEEYYKNTWTNTIDAIARLLALKIATVDAFKNKP